jgi:hypothetical protein
MSQVPKESNEFSYLVNRRGNHVFYKGTSMTYKQNPLYIALREKFNDKPEGQCWVSERFFGTKWLEIDDKEYSYYMISRHLVFGVELLKIGIPINHLRPEWIANGQFGSCRIDCDCVNPDHLEVVPKEIGRLLAIYEKDSSKAKKYILDDLGIQIAALSRKILFSDSADEWTSKELSTLLFTHKLINDLIG